VSQHVKPALSVVVAHTGHSDPAKGHGLDGQVDVNLIDRTASEREFPNKAIDRALVAAEDEGRERLRGGGDSAERLVEGLVGQDGQNRPEDLSLMMGSSQLTG
jgi:hypothetical protein